MVQYLYMLQKAVMCSLMPTVNNRTAYGKAAREQI